MRLSTLMVRKFGLTPFGSCVLGPQSAPCLQPLKMSRPNAGRAVRARSEEVEELLALVRPRA